MSHHAVELTILLPCLNEAETIVVCVQKALDWLQRAQVVGEVLVADNGSTDGSRELARREGARILPVAAKGYGAALGAGIAAAHGRYVIMADSDDSYDFSRLDPFMEKLRGGFDLVMGNRFAGGIERGAMPPLHYYLGNPVLTAIGRVLFKSPCRDFHCGLRGFRKEAILALDLQTTGMEFASEMVVKATIMKLQITEVPTTLKKDGRSRPPHLRSWRDGWRHLRFLLMYSPRWLFFFPGLALIAIGAFLQVWLLGGMRVVWGISLDIHTMLAGGCMIILGFQAVIFAVLTKVFAISEGLLPEDERLNRMFGFITLETGLAAGVIQLLIGLSGIVYLVWFWGRSEFGELDVSSSMRLLIPSVVLCSTGFQTVLGSFYLSILGLKRR